MANPVPIVQAPPPKIEIKIGLYVIAFFVVYWILIYIAYWLGVALSPNWDAKDQVVRYVARNIHVGTEFVDIPNCIEPSGPGIRAVGLCKKSETVYYTRTPTEDIIYFPSTKAILKKSLPYSELRNIPERRRGVKGIPLDVGQSAMQITSALVVEKLGLSGKFTKSVVDQAKIIAGFVIGFTILVPIYAGYVSGYQNEPDFDSNLYNNAISDKSFWESVASGYIPFVLPKLIRP
jgi:hypothetical protein